MCRQELIHQIHEARIKTTRYASNMYIELTRMLAMYELGIDSNVR